MWSVNAPHNNVVMSWQAGPTYHARQHRLCSHTKLSPPSSSHIFCCNGIWIMSRCIDTHIHRWATDHAAFQQRLSCPGYLQTQQPALQSTDLPLLPGVSEHSQLINTTDNDLIKDRLWRKSQYWVRKSRKGRNSADHKSADTGSVVLHFAKPWFFFFQS